MPLDKSGSKASVGKNIKTEEAAGKPRKQAIAIALNTQREAKKSPAKTLYPNHKGD
ncbi:MULTISPECIES: hypothetical protein [unclassified Cupriavidus]|uniref:hypothetical protein n=1 Tax=unclassified Cupriavidus TaxID=2640874 RepID=UPI002580F6A5|nr:MULTISPECIES: hypothetical protein [unclassified Cupriavidus]